jgi:hypothetical protein
MMVNLQPAKFVGDEISNWQPRRVLLFSGHMIDLSGRNPPRFPAEKEAAARQQIDDTMNKLNVGPDDLGLTQGACGGDILFAESCQQRGAKLQLLQPFTEAEFITNSVAVAGQDWVRRYRSVVGGLDGRPLAASEVLGALPSGSNAYERCNHWLLASALAYGPDKVILICLWDGNGSNAPGGTGHMIKLVKQQHGQVIWLDTRTL